MSISPENEGDNKPATDVEDHGQESSNEDTVAVDLPTIDNSDFPNIPSPDVQSIYEVVNSTNAFTSPSKNLHTSPQDDYYNQRSDNDPEYASQESLSKNQDIESYGVVNTIESISAKVDSVNSLYDSREKLVQTQNSSLYFDSGDQNTFWRTFSLIVLSPYMLVGIPVVCIYNLSKQQRQVITTPHWLRFIFSAPILAVTNAVELFAMSALNIYIIYLFFEPIQTFIQNGQLSDKLISFAIDLYELLPLMVAVNMTWLKGYLLSNIIRMTNARLIFKESNKSWLTMFKVTVSYTLILVSIVASIVSFEWKNSNNYATEMSENFYYHKAVEVCIILIIPVYSVVLSGVHSRVLNLNTYLRYMSENITSANSNEFQRIKNHFKQNADLICLVNRTFNNIMSLALIIITIRIIKEIFQVFLLVTVLDSFSISIEKGSQQVNEDIISKTSKWIMIDILVILCKFLLIVCPVRTVLITNKEINRIFLYLHDMASQYIEKPSEIYQSFSLVKYYIKARNGRVDDPAVVRLFAADWIPCIKLR